MTDQDQSAATPRLAARPVSRPLIDPAEPRAFGRPAGVAGPFLASGQRSDQGEYTPTDQPPGPVLANTGLEDLRFLTPLYPGDSMRVELSVRSKSLKSEDTGVVRWAVEIFNQRDELVATYDLLTENTP